MMLVRPVAQADIAALEALAATATTGVHSLPKTRMAIERAVQRSIASFAAQVEIASDEAYCFVLEAGANHRIIGTASLLATAGANGTFFAFRNDAIQQVSRDLDISHSVHALTLSSGLTGHSQLAAFYVSGDDHGQAALLSRARLMFAALAPHRFAERFFVSLAGLTDAAGQSPFWEALGRKFFQMDLLEAERLLEGGSNRSLIVELMPHYPVYVPLLSDAAQAAMGQVHAAGEQPFGILAQEGFSPDGFIDIFDGGTILQAHKQALNSFSAALRRRVTATVGSTAGSTEKNTANVSYLVSNTIEDRFRTVLTPAAALENSDSIELSPEAMRSLNVAAGSAVSCVRL